MRWWITFALVYFASGASVRAYAYECSVVKLPRGHVVFYAKPSAAAPVLARLQDPELIVLEEGDDSSEWIHVTIQGKEDLKGWVKGTRIHKKDCG